MMKNNTKSCFRILVLSLCFMQVSCQQETRNTTTENIVEKVAAQPIKPQKLPATVAPLNAKFVYLTFDDGPLPGSSAVNRLSQELRFKASVFIVGKHTSNNRRSSRELDDYLRNPYIDVCNHSFTHANHQYDKFYKQPDIAFADILKNQKDLNLDLKIVRLPGRQLWMMPDRDLNMRVSSASKTAEMLKTEGFKIFGWDLEWTSKGLTPKETPEEMEAKITKLLKEDLTFTRNHIVILAHDPMFQKEEGQAALTKLVTLLREKGYILENIRHYPEKEPQEVVFITE